MPELTLDDLDHAGYEEILDLLGDDLDAEPPAEPLRVAVENLAAHAGDTSLPFSYFPLAADWDADELADAAELDEIDLEDVWLAAAASVIAPYDAPDVDVLPADVLDDEDWVAIAAGLLSAGPGTTTSAASLLGSVETQRALDAAQRREAERALALVCDLWQALGVLDADRQLTPLGEWGVPRAVLEAWDDTGESADVEAVAVVTELVKHLWDRDPAAVAPQLWNAAALAAYVGGEDLAPLVAADDGWPAFLERMHDAVHGTPPAAGPAMLRALCAEQAGDVVEQQRWVDRALEADPDRGETLEIAAELAGAAGDARRARDLLRRSEPDPGDSDLATYERFARRAQGAQPRNARCACGSGRKYKLCCGTQVGHPLAARAPWVRLKTLHFLQRPASWDVLVDWAQRMCGVAPDVVDSDVVESAVSDPVVWDCALFDGGLLARFLNVRGPLLPDDERTAVATWRQTRRSAYEVVATRPGVSITLRDLLTGDTARVHERAGSRQVRPGQLLLARVLPVADVRIFGFAVTVPRQHGAALVDVLRGPTEPARLLGLMQQVRRPPQVHTIEDQQIVSATHR